MTQFAERLKELRKMAHMSQTELANAISVDQRSISNWENGINESDYDTLIKLATFFNVTIDYILGYDITKNSQ